MDEEERTAFHEAGHARIAHHINPSSVHRVRIHQEGGDWEGETNVNQVDMTDVQRTAIAIAGFLAEARAVAVRDNPARQINVTPPLLLDELHRIIGIAIANRLDRVPGNASTILSPAGINPYPSILTLEDIEFIPDSALDDDETLPAAITLACNLINNGTEWPTIIAIAERLMEIQPEPIDDLAGFLG